MDLATFFLAVPLLTAFGIAALGARGLVTRKPVAIPGWVVLSSAGVIALPTFVRCLIQTHFELPLVLTTPLLLAGCVAMWFDCRGSVTFVGIRDAAFRQAYRSALDELNLAYDEWPDRIVVPLRRVTLRLSVRTSSGVVKVAPAHEAALLGEIARATMRAYPEDGSLRARVPHAVYLACGVAYIAIGLGMLLLV